MVGSVAAFEVAGISHSEEVDADAGDGAGNDHGERVADAADVADFFLLLDSCSSRLRCLRLRILSLHNVSVCVLLV